MQKALISVVLASSVGLPLLAQEARIGGRVSAEALPVPSTIVTLSRPDTGWKRSVLTSPRGSYSLAQLIPGHYQIEALKPGFMPLRTAVHLQPGQALVFDLRLVVDPAPETVALESRCETDSSLDSIASGMRCLADLLTVQDFPPVWP